jgi:hypothetical protein
MLHTVKALHDFTVGAADGDIGEVKDVYFDDSWRPTARSAALKILFSTMRPARFAICLWTPGNGCGATAFFFHRTGSSKPRRRHESISLSVRNVAPDAIRNGVSLTCGG